MVTLVSPVFTAAFNNAKVSYAFWVYGGSDGTKAYLEADSMLICVSNNGGVDWSPVDVIGPYYQANGGWYEREFRVENFVAPTANMRLKFEISDIFLVLHEQWQVHLQELLL